MRLLPLLFFPLTLCAQSKLSPAAQYKFQTHKARRSTTDARTAAYIHLHQASNAATVRTELQNLGAEVNVTAGNILTTRIPVAQLAAVAELKGVKYVATASPVLPQLDKAREASGVNKIHSGAQLPQAYTGKGVVVGIVDAGFDYRHPAFRAADGSLRIKRVWEQSYSNGTPPEGFTYGGELSSEATILNAHGDISTNSHGTHVTAIAAGASAGTDWEGVAPDADIVLVSKGDLTEGNVNISDAVAYIYKYAESVGKPCVVNLSLGMTTGPHDGTSAFDQVADALQGPGKLLVGSAGNFGRDKVHVKAAEKDATVKTVISSKEGFSADNPSGTIDIWSDAATPFDVQVGVWNKSKNELSQKSEVMNAALETGDTQTFKLSDRSEGTITITTEVNPVNGRSHALVSLDINRIRFNNELVLLLTPRSDAAVHAWADNIYVQLTDGGIADCTAGNSEHTIAEIGGTGKRILSVGAYATRTTYTTAGTDIENTTEETLHALAGFSSTGPTLDGRTKPEITAPGTFIVSAVSSNDVSISSIPLAGSINYDGRDYCWGYMQGTSMAAPFMAGVAATWLEANPTLTPEELTKFVTASATTDSFTGNLPATGNGLWGHGKLNAHAGLQQMLSTTGITTPAIGTEVSLPIYDLMGRRVKAPRKGIYIVGGKKQVF